MAVSKEFYHDAIVERSWATLQDLRRRFSFVLISGWATWVHTHGPKSRDIDHLGRTPGDRAKETGTP